MSNAVELFNLTKDFNNVKAVDNLCFCVSESEVLGFVGPNGAGKTTTLRMLLGLAKPTAGDAIILGNSIKNNNTYLNQLGYLPDVPAFYGWMTARDFMKFVGNLFNLETRLLKSRTEELLELVGLHKENKKIKAYSRGMKQRLGLAQALINKPKVLFLDEPTSALDPIGRKEMLDTIEKIKDYSTVFFSTHILSDVERVCSKIAILSNGKLIAFSDLTSLKEKYGVNKYQITFSEINNCLIEKFNNSKLITDCLIESNKFTITVNDYIKASFEIPLIAVESNVGIISMVHTEPNLEDIFVKMVDDDGN
jgi:ABC-2 type transport system ATP-binding protein